MLKMNRIAEKYDLITHVRNLESRHGSELSEQRGLSLEAICDENDKEDLEAIIAFRNAVNQAEQEAIIAERVFNVREDLMDHLTQTEIARKEGCSIKTVHKIIKEKPELMELQKKNSAYIKRRQADRRKQQLAQKKKQRQKYGELVKWIRTNLNITTKNFARRINELTNMTTCTAGQVAGWERGKSMPNPQRMGAINKLENSVKRLERKYG